MTTPDADAESAATQLRDHVENALAGALATEGAMVTRWVALVEVIDSDGSRALWSLAPSGTKPWDTLGMLQFGLQVEQAVTTTSYLDCDDDDSP